MANRSTKEWKEESLAGYRNFYERNYETLLRVAYRYSETAEKAGEAVHRGMLEVFRLRSLAPIGGDEEDYLLGRMKEKIIECCLDMLSLPLAAGLAYATVPPDHSIPGYGDEATQARWLIEQLRRLPWQEQLVYNLLVIDRLPEERVAKLMGISRAAVAPLVSAARQRFRLSLEQRSSR